MHKPPSFNSTNQRDKEVTETCNNRWTTAQGGAIRIYLGMASSVRAGQEGRAEGAEAALPGSWGGVERQGMGRRHAEEVTMAQAADLQLHTLASFLPWRLDPFLRRFCCLYGAGPGCSPLESSALSQMHLSWEARTEGVHPEDFHSARPGVCIDKGL